MKGIVQSVRSKLIINLVKTIDWKTSQLEPNWDQLINATARVRHLFKARAAEPDAGVPGWAMAQDPAGGAIDLFRGWKTHCLAADFNHSSWKTWVSFFSQLKIKILLIISSWMIGLNPLEEIKLNFYSQYH